MAENRYRPASPSRRYADPRASTGMVFSTSFDSRIGSSQNQSRYTSEPHATRHGSVYTTQPVRKTFLDDHHPGGSVVRTEYAVRPRNNSTVGSDSRRPVSTYIRPASPPRSRDAMVSNTSYDDRRAPVASGREERYLMPAASQGRHHTRHLSASRADQDSLTRSRSSRQPEYHRRGGYNAHPAYPSSHAAAPPPGEGFSYTTPKEQFLLESSRAPPQRRDSYSRRERPTSIMGPPPRREREYGPPSSSTRALERIDRPEPYRPTGSKGIDSDTEKDLPRRRHSTRAPVVHHHREEGYSSARDDLEQRSSRTRTDRLDDDDRPRHKHRDDRDREIPREQPERVRERDRDREIERERDRPRERERPRDPDRIGKAPEERRQHRSRDSSPEQSGLRKGLAAAAGLAAAGGLAGAAVKKTRGPNEESESDDRKERPHRRRRHHHDDAEPDELAGRLEKDLNISNGERVPQERRKGDTREDDAVNDHGERRERRRHHRKHRDRSERENESDTTEDSAGRDARLRQYEKEREELREPPRSQRERATSREDDRDASVPIQQRTVSPGEEDSRPRRVQLVEPVEKKEELKPKGILKKPRAVPFPEDPNPEREGVAPLKDATKDGVPPHARWTKISRALVNPEALEKYHERFEERDEYVIVLRVVTREEIMKFAEKTREIRETRERDWKAELEERRRKKAERRANNDETYDSSSDDEGDRPALAIDQAPPVQEDFRQYVAQHQQNPPARFEKPAGRPSAAGMPTTAPILAVPMGSNGIPRSLQAQPQPVQQAMPIPAIQVDHAQPVPGSYSNNV